MLILQIVLWIFLAFAAVYWLIQIGAFAKTLRGVPRLEELDAPAPPQWPVLSVIVPARNEQAALESAARSLLATDYPALELVLVDDRSDDATGEIIDRLAAEDRRVRAVHVSELPEGWLGKVHALKCGVEASGGALLLLTDADVHFAPDALGRAVAYLQAEGLDHVAAVPYVEQSSLVVDAAVSAFIRQFVAASRPWRARDPRSRACFGVGAFNLLRREALEATEGLEWLRMEVGDDMGIGLLVKRAGRRSAALSAFEHVRVQWQTTLGQMARNAEKGYGSVCHYSVGRTVALAVLSMALDLSPLWLPLLALWPRTRAVGLAGLGITALYICTVALAHAWARHRLLPLVAGPLTAPLSAAIMLRAALVGKRRGGATWRGRVYSEAELRAGQRIRFP